MVPKVGWRSPAVLLLLAFGTSPAACSAEPPVERPAAGTSGGTAGHAEAGAPSEGGAPSEAGAPGAPDFPCDVRRVLEAKCQRCHQRPPANGAPFPLLTWNDTRATYGKQLVYEAMLVAVESGFMPLVELELTPPVEDLTSAEKTTLVSWLENGAPPDTSDGGCPR